MHLFFFFGQINFLTSRFLRFFEDFINHIFLIGLKYKIVWSITENSMCKHGQLKQFVYALFTQGQEKRSCEIRNSLILKVDQPGLEPGTSRL